MHSYENPVNCLWECILLMSYFTWATLATTFQLAAWGQGVVAELIKHNIMLYLASFEHRYEKKKGFK